MKPVRVALLTMLFTSAGLLAQSRPIDWSVTRDSARIEQGAPFAVRVHATIPKSWHLYSTSQPAGGPMATMFAAENRVAFTVQRVVPGRGPDTAVDRSFSMPTETFSDSVTFAVWLVPARPGVQALALTVSFQACTRRYCLPPASERLTLHVNVTKAAAVVRPP